MTISLAHRVSSRPLRRSWILVALVLGAAGCGSDKAPPGAESAAGSGSTSPTASGGSGGEAGEVLNEVCDTWRQGLDEREPIPVDGFDPLQPTADQLLTVAEYLSNTASLLVTTTLKLQVYSAPPDEQAAVDAFKAVLGEEQLNLRQQTDAASRGDVTGFVAAVTAGEEIHTRRVAAAEAVGADRCAF